MNSPLVPQSGLSRARDTLSYVKQSLGAWELTALGLLGLFIAITPHLTPSETAIYDLKRILQIVFLCYLAVIPILSRGFRAKWIATVLTLPVAVRLALGVFFVIGLVSSTVAAYHLPAFLEVFHFGVLVLGTVSLCTIVRSAPVEIRKLLCVIVFGAVAIYLFAFVRDYLFSQLGLSYAFKERPNALWPRGEFLGFAHPRFFNQFQTWTLPLLIPIAMATTTRLGKFLLYLVPALWWTLLFAAGGRGTILAIALAGMVIAVFAGRHRFSYLARLVGTAMAGGLLYFLLFDLLGATTASIVQRDITNPMGRFHFWDHAIDLLISNPLLGIGPAQYATFHVKFAAHPHNSIIQILSEWGVIAAAIVAVLVVTGVVVCFRRVLSTSAVDITHLAIVTSLMAGLGHSLLSGLIVTPASQVMMITVIAMAWSMTVGSDFFAHGFSFEHTGKMAHCFTVILLTITVSVEAMMSIRSHRDLQSRRAEIRLQGHHDLPRFWLYGCPRIHANDYPLLPEDG